MGKTFREWSVEQRWLLPPSVQELVPASHVAHFVRELAREELDLSEIFAAYDKQIVEPVNGHIKEARGFRRFSMRGMAKARGEWSLLCAVHNLLKLAAHRA